MHINKYPPSNPERTSGSFAVETREKIVYTISNLGKKKGGCKYMMENKFIALDVDEMIFGRPDHSHSER